jgi:hypothetical protein
MPGRTSFTKRQKEQARQQKQRDKAERKNQRKVEKEPGTADEMAEMRRLAEEQAALFHIGSDEPTPASSSPPATNKETEY